MTFLDQHPKQQCCQGEDHSLVYLFISGMRVTFIAAIVYLFTIPQRHFAETFCIKFRCQLLTETFTVNFWLKLLLSTFDWNFWCQDLTENFDWNFCCQLLTESFDGISDRYQLLSPVRTPGAKVENTSSVSPACRKRRLKERRYIAIVADTASNNNLT